MSFRFAALLAALVGVLPYTAGAQNPQDCANRGTLDAKYCDNDKDLVADAPAPVGKAAVLPARLAIAFAAVEDPAVYERTYGGLISYLSICTKVPTVIKPVSKESQIIEGMRNNEIEVGLFATGGTMFAVNQGGAIPFVGKGRVANKRADTYQLLLIVSADSAYRKPADLKGKKIAHTSATSNSGNLAPRALFPEAIGLTPDKDYTVEMSGRHDKSIVGVRNSFYDAAAVASDVFNRMIDRNEIRRDDFRIIWRSADFPTDSFAHTHSLDPRFAKTLKQCFLKYQFPAEMSKQLEGADRYYPLDYSKDWALVRLVAEKAGQRFDRDAYQALLEKDKKK